ncbi:MAG: glycoside hydrolase family 2, partial [Phycisphaerae bacterium]|nr:glycoside hydrolase family 2 [Phycisphaerae bacterium]
MRIVQIFVVALAVAALNHHTSGREIQNFDHDWRFHFGEVENGKTLDFDDSKWRTLDVPHDWMIEKSFDEYSPGNAEGGSLDGGVGWYRKTFTLPKSAQGQRVFVDFDGVYMNSDVWLNGVHLGNHPYGYTSFEYDLTPSIKFDALNVLAVRTEVMQPCSRFYSGGGIYRNVRLVVTDPIHIAHWGTTVTSEIDGDHATIHVATSLVNDGSENVPVDVEDTVIDDTGKSVASVTTKGVRVDHATTQSTELKPQIKIGSIKRWSIETPTLYHLRTDVIRDGKIIDSVDTSFGLRTAEFTVNDGFHLNGKRVEIHGVCDHHDLGCLGSAINTRALERQLQILRGFGVNAIRTSHNPPAPELLDLCDRMGFVVMDEAFDEWRDSKRELGYGRFFDQWANKDLSSMILRDRNHPSVVVWSIGNEIREQSSMADGYALSKQLTDVCHQLDPTRPVTAAMHTPVDAVRTRFSEPLDVFGVNYNVRFYDNPAVHGKKPMVGSETSSEVSSRGEYCMSLVDGEVATTQRANFQVSNYNGYVPSWATSADTDLRSTRDATWMAGDFVWTGFDYIGEPTPFGWPSRSSYFG